ncbi:vWA domain-containing protein [Labrys okinawensis]|uniref:vWA domain-containing protein n=1 Tax=Labrys okinawensis TaxID=346911 RepID=UPI0039BC6914
MMHSLAAFHFIRPLWLLALLPALGLFLLQHYRSDTAQRWRRVIDPDLLQYLLVGSERRSRFTPNGLLLLVWILAITAISGPTWRLEASPFADNKPPVMVVLKVTASMTTKDLAPTRLDRARQKLSDLLALREGASTGLIVYGGSAHLVLPPTADKDVVLSMAGALSPGIMPADGDALSSAMAMADGLLSQNDEGGSILVLADTVAGDQINALSGLTLKHGVTILALLGPNEDTSELADAARALGADLIPTTVEQADIATVDSAIDRSQRTTAVAGQGRSWREAGYWLVPALLLFTLGWFRRGWVVT